MILPTCREAVQMMAEATGDEPWHRRLLLRLHLSICDGCAKFRAQLRLLGEAFRSFRLPGDELAGLQTRVRARLK